MTKAELNAFIDLLILDLAINEFVTLDEFHVLFNQIETARIEMNNSLSDLTDLLDLD